MVMHHFPKPRTACCTLRLEKSGHFLRPAVLGALRRHLLVRVVRERKGERAPAKNGKGGRVGLVAHDLAFST